MLGGRGAAEKDSSKTAESSDSDYWRGGWSDGKGIVVRGKDLRWNEWEVVGYGREGGPTLFISLKPCYNFA